jgi:hypothetical protein
MTNFTRDFFDVDHIPEWNCPECTRGILQLSGQLSIEDDSSTKNHSSEDYFEPEHSTYTIQGMFKCSRSLCSETVMMLGTGFCDQDEGYIDGEYQQYYANYCKPTFFQPYLNIFEIPDYVPDEITIKLKQSFGLFFCDSDSCGNRIRASIEILLNDIGSPPTRVIKGGKVKAIALQDRIKELTGNHESIKDILSAIRIIGNDASHSESSLCRQDTLDAYVIVEFILEILYKPQADTAGIYQLARQKISEDEAKRQQ